MELEKGAEEMKRGPRGPESVPVFGDRVYHGPPRPYSGTMNKQTESVPAAAQRHPLPHGVRMSLAPGTVICCCCCCYFILRKDFFV